MLEAIDKLIEWINLRKITKIRRIYLISYRLTGDILMLWYDEDFRVNKVKGNECKTGLVYLVYKVHSILMHPFLYEGKYSIGMQYYATILHYQLCMYLLYWYIEDESTDSKSPHSLFSSIMWRDLCNWQLMMMELYLLHVVHLSNCEDVL